MAAVTKNRNFSFQLKFLSKRFKWNKLAEKISQKNPEYAKLLIAMYM
jgi:hypothetical protein